MTTPAPALDTLSPRVAAMQPSATLAISGRAAALRREGRDVIALSAGEPDFPTPAPIVEAAHQALRDERFSYTPNPGIPELREAIAKKLQTENGLDVQAAQVVCSNGAKQSVAQAVLAICQPGDEVVIPAPYWVSYPEMARLAGATPVSVLATSEADYKLTPDQLADAITEQTRVLILNSPSNPTGAVYTPDELEGLAAVLREHPHVAIISDEIYEHVLFDADFASFAALDGMAERTCTVNGFSKAFAMTGWRLGYLAAPAWWSGAVAKIQSQLTSGPSSITQYASLAAFEMGPEVLEEMVGAFRQRRDAVLERLRAIDGVTCPTPEGAFYLFPDVSALYGRQTPDGAEIAGSVDFCTYLLEARDVALVPGEAFGNDAGVRISYATDLDTLMTACDRIEAGVVGLR
ncbi:pyridoxal phosphate-dependent aminotransferase [Rubrivirga marina]|uniref:Aminotransferase n=1 Tax=Rubrivirga marina TaxID=1196024 RepID=A0A271J5A4_9BACT|nr:pyridoxal phosphate-dependent aminotransferase [Rubrivirga marina]PAP78447.1 aspartate aminotransferase [Rubrivirga marina]